MLFRSSASNMKPHLRAPMRYPKSALKSPANIAHSRKNSEQNHRKGVPLKLRFVPQSASNKRGVAHPDSRLSYERPDDSFEPCILAIQNNMPHPVNIFADADSIVCYKADSDVIGAASEDASSTSGSYILTEDAASAVAVSKC